MTHRQRKKLWKKFDKAVDNVDWLGTRWAAIASKAQTFVALEGNEEIWEQIKQFADNPIPHNNTVAGLALSAIAALNL